MIEQFKQENEGETIKIVKTPANNNLFQIRKLSETHFCRNISL
jgi:hypothetical protein